VRVSNISKLIVALRRWYDGDVALWEVESLIGTRPPWLQGLFEANGLCDGYGVLWGDASFEHCLQVLTLYAALKTKR